MDSYYLQNQSNYDNHMNFNPKYDSYDKRASFDSAYGSFLLTSQNSPSSSSFSFQSSSYYTDVSSSSSSSSAASHLFSHPTTPVKSSGGFIYNGNNSSTTPDFKQQYVADINSYYFASIRSTGTTATPSTCSSYTSPYKSSLSNSPSKYDTSFVHKRDTFSNKLLRSPAFKLDSPYSSHYHQIETTPTKPTIKSFSSRFQANLNLAPPEPIPIPAAPKKPTPTEEEFMEMLVANHHIPDYPESLIGRNMGIEHVDILSELTKRSMNNIVEKVFSYLSTSDCVRVGCVSKEWRSLIKQDTKRNKERVKLIKKQKYLHETSKENMCQLDIGLINSSISYHNMSMDSPLKANVHRRSAYLTCEQVSLRENLEVEPQFISLNLNCMHNLYINKPQLVLKPTKAYKSPVKKERLSPVKRCLRDIDSSVPSASSTNAKIDLIGSKKSKKNLKRL